MHAGRLTLLILGTLLTCAIVIVHAQDDARGRTTPTGGEMQACATAGAPRERIDCLTGATLRHGLGALEAAAERDPRVASDCHMAMHPVGEQVGRDLARAGDPLPLERPRSFCHEGYVHGMQVAWLGAASTSELVRGGARACDASDPKVDWACGHSIGHALAAHEPSGGMAVAMRHCARTYDGAVHLGLDRDAFLTTCAKGALMEFTMRDERAGVTDPSAHACGAVDRELAPWCEGHVWLRAGLGEADAASNAAQLATCDELARTLIGRAACAGMVGRGIDGASNCMVAAPDLRAACRDASELGPIDPAAIPAS